MNTTECLSGGNCSYIARLSVRDLHGPTIITRTYYLITGKSSDAVSHSAISGEPIIVDPSTVDQPKELPFQVQITHTDLDGAQALRLITKAKPVTRDRAIAEKRKFFIIIFHCKLKRLVATL